MVDLVGDAVLPLVKFRQAIRSRVPPILLRSAPVSGMPTVKPAALCVLRWIVDRQLVACEPIARVVANVQLADGGKTRRRARERRVADARRTAQPHERTRRVAATQLDGDDAELAIEHLHLRARRQAAREAARRCRQAGRRAP